MLCTAAMAISPEWISAFLTLVIAGATIYYALMSRRQWQATQASIKETAAALEMTNRARIVATGVVMGQSSCFLTILNCGPVPAVNTRVRIRAQPGRRDAVPDFAKCEREFRSVVAPGAEWKLEFPAEPEAWKFTPVASGMFPSSRKPGDPDTVQIFGTIVYGDHFNPRRHARFSFQMMHGSWEFEPGVGNDYP